MDRPLPNPSSPSEGGGVGLFGKRKGSSGFAGPSLGPSMSPSMGSSSAPSAGLPSAPLGPSLGPAGPSMGPSVGTGLAGVGAPSSSAEMPNSPSFGGLNDTSGTTLNVSSNTDVSAAPPSPGAMGTYSSAEPQPETPGRNRATNSWSAQRGMSGMMMGRTSSNSSGGAPPSPSSRPKPTALGSVSENEVGADGRRRPEPLSTPTIAGARSLSGLGSKGSGKGLMGPNAPASIGPGSLPQPSTPLDASGGKSMGPSLGSATGISPLAGSTQAGSSNRSSPHSVNWMGSPTYQPRFPRSGTLGSGSPANLSPNKLGNGRNTPENNRQQDGSDNSPVVDVDAEAAAYGFLTRCTAAMLLFTMHWFGIQKWLNWNHDGKSEDDDVAQFLYEFEGAFHTRIFSTSPAPGPTRTHQRDKAQATAKVAHLSSLDLLHVRGRALSKIEEAVEPPPELFALQDGKVEDDEEEDEIVACCRKRPWWSRGLFVACQALFCFVTWLFFAATYQPYEMRIMATAYAEENTLAFKIGDDGNSYSFLDDEKNLESCKTECNLYDSCQGVYFKHHLRSQCVLLADFPAEPCRNNCTIEYDSAMYQKATMTYWSFANFVGGLESIFPGETTLRTHGTFCEGYNEQAYRLLTYQFTHANLQHVLSTIFCVIFFGIPLELTEGSVWLFFMYQAGIVGGGLCTWLVTPHSNTVGASGGSYVLLGWHVSNLVLHWKRQKFRKAKALLFVSFLLADSVCYALREHHGDVDYLAASVGGFIFGLLAELSTGGSVVDKLGRSETKRRVVGRYLALLAFILGMGAVTWYITNPFPGVRSFFDWFGTDFGPWCWVAQACIRPDYSNLGTCPSEWQCVACESRDCVEKWYKFAESDQQPGVNIVVTTWSACQGMAKLLVAPPSIAA